jgi:glutaconyl-CoA/methylmalonyl-CoA decarboxylase subunit gamma
VKYWVEIGGRKLAAGIAADIVELDGRAHAARMGAVGTSPVRIMVLDGRSYEVVAVPGGERGKWRLAMGGERFDVDIVDERQHAIRALLGRSGPAPTGGLVKAPMPGLIVRVLVEEGQVVPAGAGVVVVEAMKMENELAAAVGGVVRKVHVVPGATVEKGQVVVEIVEDGLP